MPKIKPLQPRIASMIAFETLQAIRDLGYPQDRVERAAVQSQVISRISDQIGTDLVVTTFLVAPSFRRIVPHIHAPKT